MIKDNFLKLMFNILKKVQYHLAEGMKVGKVEKLVSDLNDKTEYAIHIKKLKHALNHELVLKKLIE